MMAGEVLQMTTDKYQILPPLSAEEFAALKEDIERNGVLVPVEYDEHGTILDGHHRVQAHTELRNEGKALPPWPRLVRSGMSEEQKRQHARTLNLTRRHLTKETRELLWIEMRREGMSYRQIAEADGTAHFDTVRRAVSSVANSTVDLPETVTGKDGKKRKAKSSKPKKQTKQKTTYIAPETVEKIEALPEESREAVFSGETKITEAQRQVRNTEKVARVAALPEGQYHIIYADPPWQYNDKRETGDHRESTGAEHHYPTMSIDALKEMPVRDMAAKDCALFCWATFPLLPDALDLVKAWGFTYKTAFVWDKGRGAFGHYHNAAAELLIVATRGSGTPQTDKRADQVQSFASERHSRKPEEWRQLIYSLYPSGPRIELFRRGDAPKGWHIWGAEIEVGQ
jgi:N6-adenosine-specific RNA methylase IME4